MLLEVEDEALAEGVGDPVGLMLPLGLGEAEPEEVIVELCVELPLPLGERDELGDEVADCVAL